MTDPTKARTDTETAIRTIIESAINTPSLLKMTRHTLETASESSYGAGTLSDDDVRRSILRLFYDECVEIAEDLTRSEGAETAFPAVYEAVYEYGDAEDASDEYNRAYLAFATDKAILDDYENSHDQAE